VVRYVGSSYEPPRSSELGDNCKYPRLAPQTARTWGAIVGGVYNVAITPRDSFMMVVARPLRHRRHEGRSLVDGLVVYEIGLHPAEDANPAVAVVLRVFHVAGESGVMDTNASATSFLA